MGETYFIIPGGLFKQINQNAFKYCSKWVWIHIKQLFLYMFVFISCSWITSYVFFKCIIVNFTYQRTYQIALVECISLGSIFATFGSAIISFLSLVSARQLSGFQEKVSILNEKFINADNRNWKRWDFISRFSRERSIDGKYDYYVLRNAALEFHMEGQIIKMPIPSVEQDLKDLPVLSGMFKMRRKRKLYLSYVQRQSHISDFYIWDCLMTLYKNIIFYRLSQVGIWIGTSYIINSFIFAFFYNKIYPYINILFQ